MATAEATPIAQLAAAAPGVRAVALANILVATDFSAASDAALRFGAALAHRQRSKIYLFHALPFLPGYPKPMEGGPPEVSGDENEANIKLGQALIRPELSGVACDALLCRSELWPALEANIRRFAIDLVVVGTHGREGLKKLLLGSIAEQVFRQSPCPVLTVGPHVEFDTLQDGGFRRVVYATDFSDSSLHSLPFAIALAKQNLSMLHVLCSDFSAGEYGRTVFDSEDVVDTRERLRHLLPPGIEAEEMVEVGFPASTIVRVARGLNASLIVMGVNPSSQFAATHLPWATAHRVICDAHCPVLTVR